MQYPAPPSSSPGALRAAEGLGCDPGSDGAGCPGGCLLWLNRDRSLPGEGVTLPDYVQKDLLPVNPWSRPGTPLEKIDAW